MRALNYQPHQELPNAPQVEEAIISICLSYATACDVVSYLKPEHFYQKKHRVIWEAIQKTEPHDKILVVARWIRNNGHNELIGGAFYLSQLMAKCSTWQNIDQWGRILQQFWIRRELIRISQEVTEKAFDESEDEIELFDNLLADIDRIQDVFTPSTGKQGFISNQANELTEIQKERDGTRERGLMTGYRELDDWFRFKQGNFVVINGLDNVGKTAIITHLAVVSNYLHGWRWMMACMENSVSDIRIQLIQSKTGKHISRLTQEEFEAEMNWAYNNFILFDIRKDMSAHEILHKAERIHNQNGNFQAFLIDPYNSLRVDLQGSKLNSHEYHYEATTAMRNFSKRTGCGVWVNTHAITEATRRKYPNGDKLEGYIMPPEKGDVEGGGKFANRADEFLTVHRLMSHPEEHNVTQIHVRKVKDTSTGGRVTMKDYPVKLKTVKGYFGFFDMEGNSPIIKTKLNDEETKNPF